MKNLKLNQPYECDFLNEHLGSLKFSYSTWQSYRRENLHSSSRKDKYISSSVTHIVTANNETYELKDWIKRMEAKIKELKEEFILEELILLKLNLPHNNGKYTEDVYFEALKSYSYRFWESFSYSHWTDFNYMLNHKYPTEMSKRLISSKGVAVKESLESDSSNSSSDNLSLNINEQSNIECVSLPYLEPFHLDTNEDNLFSKFY